MFSVKHVTAAAVAVALLVSAAHSVNEADVVTQRKGEAVRTALERLGKEVDNVVLVDAANRASALLQLEYLEAADTPLLTIHTSGAPVYDWFTLDNGKRIVIDLYSTINFESGNRIEGGADTLVKEIRTSLFALEPMFVSRTVVALTERVPFRITQTDEGHIAVALNHSNHDFKVDPALDSLTTQIVDELAHQRNRADLQAVRLSEYFGRFTAEAQTQSDDREPLDDLTLMVIFGEQTHSQNTLLGMLAKDCEAVHNRIHENHATLETALEAGKSVTDTKQDLSSLLAAIRKSGQQDPGLFANTLEAKTEITQHMVERIASAKPIPTVVYVKQDEPIELAAPGSDEDTSLQIASNDTDGALDLLTSELDKLSTDTSITTLEQVEATDLEIIRSTSPQIDAAAGQEAPAEGSAPAEDDKKPDFFENMQEMFDSVKSPTEQDAEKDVQAEVEDMPAEETPEEEVVAEPTTPETPMPEAAPVTAAPAPAPAVTVAETVPVKKKAPRPVYKGDPMEQLVTLQFRDVELTHLVQILARKANINVIGVSELTGKTSNINLENVPLRQALRTALSMEDMGIIEEAGIFRIVPLEDALAASRISRMVPLNHAPAEEVMETLTIITQGLPPEQQVQIGANKTSNVIILAGPPDKVQDFEALIFELDIAEPPLPTITEVIPLNYSEPQDLLAAIEPMLTPETGKVQGDTRSRQLIVKDVPVVVEQIKELIKEIDQPVKQVAMEATIVDVVLSDDAQTGVDWFVNLLRRHNSNGELVGNLDQLSFDNNAAGDVVGASVISPAFPGAEGLLNFGLLSSDFSIRGLITAEIESNNAELLANPNLVTLENLPATIDIIQEFPYREVTQTDQGGQIGSTKFKEIGTKLQVTPRVTYDNDIMVHVTIEQNGLIGLSADGAPITNTRKAETNVRTGNGETIFIGGLRRVDDSLNIRKVPVLGDVPIVNFLFRTTTNNKQNTDLLLFLTSRVLGEKLPPLNAREQENFDRLDATPEVPDSQRKLFRSYIKPQEIRDPIWKWRR